MRKQMTLIISLLLVILMFSGCMDIRVGFSLNEDGTGGMNALMAINQSLMGDAETSELDADFFDETGINEPNSTVESQVVEFYKDEMLFVGEEYNIEFEDALIALSDFEETDGLYWIYQGDDIFRFEIPLGEINTQVANEGLGDMSTMFNAMGGQILYSFETDYEVIDHNADYIEDQNNYVWDLTEDIFSTSPKRQVGYLEVKIELEASENPVREDLEETLDLDRTDKNFHGEALEALGYLRGTDEGLELDRGLTRAEGAIMYSRLLGIEEDIEMFAAENPTYESGFTDVPMWAQDTINYLHSMGLVNGISDTLYGSSAPMTEAQYTTLVLRALGYSDSEGDFTWDASAQKALEIGLYADDIRAYVYAKNDAEGSGFTRRFMSYISYNALFYENEENGEMLYESRAINQ